MVIECIDKFLYMEFKKLINENIGKLEKSKIVIFGAGIMGLQLCYVLREYSLSIFAFSDNDHDKWGKKWAEVPVIAPQELKQAGDIFLFIAMENYRECQVQLEQMGYVLNRNLAVAGKGIKDKYVQDFMDKNGAEILVFGDCTLNIISLQEEKKESLGEKFDKDIRVKVLSQNGLYMRFYYNILDLCLKNMRNLKKVFIMFSVDIFSNQYHLLPANQHCDIIESILQVSGAADEEFLAFQRDAKARSQGMAVNYSAPDRYIGDEQAIRQELKNHMKVNYLYKIRKDNESVIYLSRFVRRCTEMGIECRCIIMPVNYEVGIQLFSSDFISRYESNKAVICDCISKEKGSYLDMSYQLQQQQFISVRSSNEGIFSSGRNEVYDRVGMYL